MPPSPRRTGSARSTTPSSPASRSATPQQPPPLTPLAPRLRHAPAPAPPARHLQPPRVPRRGRRGLLRGRAPLDGRPRPRPQRPRRAGRGLRGLRQVHGPVRRLVRRPLPQDLRERRPPGAHRHQHQVRQCYPLPSPVYSCATLTALDLYNCRLRLPERLAGLRAVRSLGSATWSPRTPTSAA